MIKMDRISRSIVKHFGPIYRSIKRQNIAFKIVDGTLDTEYELRYNDFTKVEKLILQYNILLEWDALIGLSTHRKEIKQCIKDIIEDFCSGSMVLEKYTNYPLPSYDEWYLAQLEKYSK